MKALMFLIVLSTSVYGQGQPSARDSIDGYHETLETLLEEEELGDEEAEGTDYLVQLSENPIDLNTAGFKELQHIPDITPLIAYRILSARNTRPFSSVRDLLSVEGFDQRLYRRAIPFVTVQPPHSALPFSFQVRSRIQSDIQKRSGYVQGDYPGGREKLYTRVSLSAALSPTVGVQMNVTSEKDPGEMLADGFLSAYLSFRLPTLTVSAGDFSISSGNVHVFARGFRPGGKQGIRRETPVAISGYRSSDEHRFFRGVAATGSMLGVSFGMFYSNKSVHGTILNGTSLSLYRTGLFRTPGEQSKRNVTRERVAGGFLSAHPGAGFSAGLAGFDARFLAGRRALQAIGVNVAWEGRIGGMSGSVAGENAGGRSFSAAATLEPFTGWTFSLATETFTRGFSGPYTLTRSPVSESVSAAGVRARLNRWSRIHLSIYREDFREGRQGRGFSEYEHGAMIESFVSVSSDLQIDLRFRMRTSPYGMESIDSLGRRIILSEVQELMKFRIGVSTGRRTAVAWTSRIELARASAPDGAARLGLMISQEIRYVPAKDLRIQAKVTLFAIDAYDARVFAFEPSVPGMMVNRVLQGEGTRSALSLLYRIMPAVEISGAFSTEVQDGRRAIGSGLEEIQGDTQSRFTLQIDLRF